MSSDVLCRRNTERQGGNQRALAQKHMGNVLERKLSKVLPTVSSIHAKKPTLPILHVAVENSSGLAKAYKKLCTYFEKGTGLKMFLNVHKNQLETVRCRYA